MRESKNGTVVANAQSKVVEFSRKIARQPNITIVRKYGYDDAKVIEALVRILS